MGKPPSSRDLRRLHEAEHEYFPDPVADRGLVLRDGNWRRCNDGSDATKHPVAHPLRGSSVAVRRWGRGDGRQQPGLDIPGESLVGGFP